MHITSINVSSFWYENDPFMLTSQVQQAFYIDDYKMGQNWKVVQKVSHHHLWDYLEKLSEGDNEDEIDDVDAYQEDNVTDIQITFESAKVEQHLNRKDVEPIEVTLKNVDDNEHVNELIDIYNDSESNTKNEPLLNSDDVEDSDSSEWTYVLYIFNVMNGTNV